MEHIKQDRVEHYVNLQRVCQQLLEKMENYCHLDLSITEPQELLKLDALLKIRSRLIEFENQIQQEHDAIRSTSRFERQKNREQLIQTLITKIKKATQS
jgi:hypothetical protein